MAVTTQNSTEYESLYGTTLATLYPDELGGVKRVVRFTHDQSGAGDATSSVALCKLPAGRVRVFLAESWAYVNWTTALATLDLGWDAYINLSDGATVSADPDGLIDGLDVDAVGIRQFSTTATAAVIAAGYTKLFESREGVVIRATTQDVAIVAGNDLVGHLTYVIE